MPWYALKTSTRILNSILTATGNQWSSLSIGVICSVFEWMIVNGQQSSVHTDVFKGGFAELTCFFISSILSNQSPMFLTDSEALISSLSAYTESRDGDGLWCAWSISSSVLSLSYHCLSLLSVIHSLISDTSFYDTDCYLNLVIHCVVITYQSSMSSDVFQKTLLRVWLCENILHTPWQGRQNWASVT